MSESNFTINSLETATPSSSDFFLKSNGNTEYRKCTLGAMGNAIIANAFPVAEVDLSSKVNSNFTATRAKLKKIGNFHWCSIQVTCANNISAPYGQTVISVGSDIAPFPSYTAELNGYNVTTGNCIRAYRSNANISIVGNFTSGDVIIIGGMYIV